MRNTVYVRPPDKRPTGPKSARTPKGPVSEVSGGLFRYRVQLTPALLAFLLGAWTAIMEALGDRVNPKLVWIIPIALVTMAAWVWFLGIEKPLSKPDTQRKRTERIYGLAVLAFALAWNRFVTFDVTVSLTLKWYAVLALASYPIAAPWIWHRRIRSSIPIHFDPRIPFKARRQMEFRGRTVIHDWASFTRASAAAGSDLISISFDLVSVVLRVRLGRARVAQDFTDLRKSRLESAFDARLGSARVMPVKDASARMVDIRFMLADPLKDAIIPTEADVTEDDEMTLDIGVFESGAKVIIDIVHTLIAGASDAGKSGIVNAIMRGLVRKRKIAILGIDMKPGAPELGKWRSSMEMLATTDAEVEWLLTMIVRAIVRRGEIMSQRGIRKWIPTEEEPFIVLIVDEAAQIKKAGRKLTMLLVKVSELARAYGFAMIMATQHPTDKSIPTEAAANCIQRIGLECKASTAERLIFGDDATKDGWRLGPKHMKAQGMFRVQSRRYGTPNLARSYWLDDASVDAEVIRYAPSRVPIDSGTWNPGLRSTSRRAIEPEEDEGTTVAVIVEDSPEEGVFMAVCAGVGTPKAIADYLGMPLRTVERCVKDLAQKGMIKLDVPKARASVKNPWRKA